VENDHRAVAGKECSIQIPILNKSRYDSVGFSANSLQILKEHKPFSSKKLENSFLSIGPGERSQCPEVTLAIPESGSYDLEISWQAQSGIILSKSGIYKCKLVVWPNLAWSSRRIGSNTTSKKCFVEGELIFGTAIPKDQQFSVQLSHSGKINVSSIHFPAIAIAETRATKNFESPGRETSAYFWRFPISQEFSKTNFYLQLDSEDAIQDWNQILTKLEFSPSKL
jgi:hypothetical protein